jgi:hypothetical protein
MVNAANAELSTTLLAMVGGGYPTQVLEYMSSHFQVVVNEVRVHWSWPNDFLVLLNDILVVDRILHDPLSSSSFSFFLVLAPEVPCTVLTAEVQSLVGYRKPAGTCLITEDSPDHHWLILPQFRDRPGFPEQGGSVPIFYEIAPASL